MKIKDKGLVTVQLHNNIIDQLRALADAEERSLGNFIKIILKDYLRSGENKI